MKAAEPFDWRRLGSVEEAIMKVVGDHYGLAPSGLSLETEFSADLGADYIDVQEVLMTVEELFTIYFESDTAGDSVRTVGDLVQLVRTEQLKSHNHTDNGKEDS